ncbi:MAG: Rieske 2Fe-2S domain-containing protein, partial [Sphingomonadales bacterium]|nr:Rieske 2Fe-2S domain-containing protein [Sphingomonadales bacterium]
MATSAEYKLGEYAFPRGWFAVANGSEAGRKPSALHYFGQDLVMYRGTSGRVVVLDAYCPHMGTHLASGPSTATSRSDSHMEGDNIRCPFHAWRFGP